MPRDLAETVEMYPHNIGHIRGSHTGHIIIAKNINNCMLQYSCVDCGAVLWQKRVQ